MFKMVAILGLVAGGAGYAVYSYTDLFTDHSAGKGSCCGSRAQADVSPCCLAPQASDEAGETTPVSAAKPDCCESAKPCCDTAEACCPTAKVAAKATAACCPACCESSAPAAVAGPAAVFAAAATK